MLAGDVREPAIELWQLSMSNMDLGLAEGLWNIWGRITDEFTNPAGDPQEGERLALEAAGELRRALGDEQSERRHCDCWIHERLDIT